MSKPQVSLFWFRRDLRLHDNAGLYHALAAGRQVIPLFIFDRAILSDLEDRDDRRVSFIYDQVLGLHNKLSAIGSGMEVRYGLPLDVFSELLQIFDLQAVYANHDYEPYAIDRDRQIQELLMSSGIPMHTFKDQVIFEKKEVMKSDGTPFAVFTPYSRRWKACLGENPVQVFDSQNLAANFLKMHTTGLPSLEEMGFARREYQVPPAQPEADIIRHYADTRNFPWNERGTSRLGVHLRFGTISIRQLVREAVSLSETFLNELIWREFYQMILWNFPHVAKGYSFKKEYDHIQWRNDEEDFRRWCLGQTGYPIVDAGMRELEATGFMHNRVRMIVASFLTKHLLIDWRWGEAWFARKLMDFELASNNGGWQWAAGSGVDAAPYFRVFNPYLQTQKFDDSLTYIKRWVPELNEFSYPRPMVEHDVARKRALDVYGSSLKKSKGLE